VEPLDRSAIWPYVDGEPGAYYYQRYGHPTGAEAERALGALEGGSALLFPSGAAATAALVLALLEPGDTIALARDAYYGTSVLFRELERWGLQFVEFDQTGAPPGDADLVWIESPSNPLLTVPDFDAAAAHPAPLVIDSTASTPIYLRPLERDADFAVHSATKYLGGHHDLLLGAVVCRDAQAAERLREFRTRTGIVAAPDAAWLLLRGLKTLEVRMRRHTETAKEIARRLGEHPGVERVRYLVRRGRRSRRRPHRRDLDPHDPECHEPRRRRLRPRDPPSLGGRPSPGKPDPAERRARRRRRSLGRPRRSACGGCNPHVTCHRVR